MYLYKYSGPVKSFNLIVASKWEAYTYAVSEGKAKSNIAFQFKKKFGLAPNAKITLPGTIKIEEIVWDTDERQLNVNDYLKSINKPTIAI